MDIALGKSRIYTKALEFGGGRVGPGRVSEFSNYDRLTKLRWSADYRSARGGSGVISIQLADSTLYRTENVATSHNYERTSSCRSRAGWSR